VPALSNLNWGAPRQLIPENSIFNSVRSSTEFEGLKYNYGCYPWDCENVDRRICGPEELFQLCVVLDELKQ